MKQHLRWFWNYLAISGLLSGVFGLAFLFLPPFQMVTELLLCHPDEHLVTETQVTTGTSSGTETQGCCAKRTDTRTFGKCDWGSGFSRDSLTVLVPMGISVVSAMVCGVFVTLAIHRTFGRAKPS